ncbi:MAG: NADH-quinone oxidoreductase subunit J [Burkholderiaceae bacterium]|jgi:NADH-quinone oxidoreductase subunit J|nr:MAG: NADH-quinone oxidoreductase subunit J [Burkholderiaceae bacterium]
MDVTTAFFYLFSAVMLFAAFQVITARNPVHAVLFLMLAFSQAAGLWLLLQAEFLAVILVLVYLGAVMVLFLFVVMMLDIHIERIRRGFWRNFPLALAVGAVIAIEMGIVVVGGFDLTHAPAMADALNQSGQYSNTRALGVLLYGHYLFPVEVAVTILLVAMIAAIALTYRERHDNKAIDPGLQVRVQPKDRVQILKMASTQAAPPPAPAPAASGTKTPEAKS